MKTWLLVKAELSAAPFDWSAWDDVFERHGVNGTVVTDSPPTIGGYLGPGQDPDALVFDLVRAGAASTFVEEVPEVDWSEAWKQFFKPTRIGERIVIVPSWESFETGPGDVVVTLDPGQAFGTGDHPTTRGCLRLIEAEGVAGKRVADIGCGSGILTIAAVKLGAAEAVAVDLDAESVETCGENCLRNGVEATVLLGAGCSVLPDGWVGDIVVSNIISAALIGMAADVASRVRPGGVWIVSGIIEANWPDVLAKAGECGFVVKTVLQEGEWIAATFQR